MFEVADLFNLGVEWAWGWLRAQADSALLFILLSAVSQMPPDHPLPLSPMHLRRERQLLQLPPALLGHPHRHPHCVLGLLHLWEAGHSWHSAGPLKQPSKLRSWPALGVRPCLLWLWIGRRMHRSALGESGKQPEESCCPVTSQAAEGSSPTGST